MPGSPCPGSDHRRWLSASFWCTVGNAAGRGLPFVALLGCARLVPQADYGRIGVAHAAVQAFSVFGGLALNQVVTHLAARSAADPDPSAWPRLRRRIWRIGMIMLAAATAGMLTAAPFLAKRLLGDPALTLSLLLGAAWMAASVIQGTVVGELMGLGRFREAAQHNALAGALASLAMLAGGWLWSAPGVIGGIAVGYTAAILVYAMRSRAGATAAPPAPDRAGGDVVRLLVLFSLGGALVWPTNLLLQLWLARQPDGLAEAAAFAVGNQLRMAILMLTASLGGGSLALLSAISHRDEPRRFLRVWLFGTAITMGACLVATAPMILAPDLVLRLAGKAYAGNAGVLRWLGLCCLAQTALSGATSALTAMAHATATIAIAGCYAAVCLLWALKGGDGCPASFIAVTQTVATLAGLLLAVTVLFYALRTRTTT